MSGRRITVYTRAGCHLCDVAIDAVRALATESGAAIELVDIESDAALHARYLERIPVIALDAEELYDHFVDLDDLRSRLVPQPGR